MALRTSIIQRTDDDLLTESIDKRFRPALATFSGVPPGLHIVSVVLSTPARLTDAQLNALETAIKAINGVNAALVMVLGPVAGTPTPPANHAIDLQLSMNFATRPLP